MSINALALLMPPADPSTALIVMGNKITANRIKAILKQRGWQSSFCDDGDKSVDEYVRVKPSLVFMDLDLPTMNGHVAALEMRETDPNVRIVFVSSRSRLERARNAAYSAGAVAVLTTPLTRADIDDKWEQINSQIPDAPGLADLDELYPEIPEKNTPPPQDIPMPVPVGLPPLPSIGEKKTKSKWKTIALITLLVIASGSAAIAFFMGFIEV